MSPSDQVQLEGSRPGSLMLWLLLFACPSETEPPGTPAPVGTLGLAQIGVRLVSDMPVYSLAAPDLDGDGLTDLALSSSWEMSLLEAPLSSGRAEELGRSVEIGGTLAVLGDTDGDGLDDTALGAHIGALWLDRAAEEPVIRWFSGSGTDSAGWIFDPDVLQKRTNNDLYYALVGPGDLDGDNVPDLVVAMDGVWVFHGPLPAAAELAEADLVIEPDPGVRNSRTVGGSDWNADGVPDLALISRPSGEDLEISLLDGSGSGAVALEDVTFASGLGASAASGRGDIDGDGLDDLVLGAGAYSGPIPLAEPDGFDFALGPFSIAYGPIRGPLGPLADGVDGDGGDAIVSAAIVGDIDRDGFDDLVFGAPGQKEQPGSAAVIYGPIRGRVAYDDADARLVGEWVESGAGTLVAPAGDLDGDGYADFAVAATDEPYEIDTVYLLFGGPR